MTVVEEARQYPGQLTPLPRIKKQHVNLTPGLRMKVKLAAQVSLGVVDFAENVALGENSCIPYNRQTINSKFISSGFE